MLDQYYIIIMPAVTPPVMLRLQPPVCLKTPGPPSPVCELKEWTELIKSELSSK